MLWIVSALFGFAAWYGYYGLECVINGAPARWSTPFACAWSDLLFNLPGGWERRLRAARGDEEWAAEFPGLFYAFCIHAVLPAGVAFLTYSFGSLLWPQT